MSSREQILSELRASQSAIPSSREGKPPPPLLVDRELFRDYPRGADASVDLETLMETFAARFTALSGELVRARDETQAAGHLVAILNQLGCEPGNAEVAFQQVAFQQSATLDRLRAVSPDLDALLGTRTPGATTEPLTGAQLERCRVGITSADRFIARTGSVLARSTTTGGRRLSVLPPVHVVVGQTDQLVPSIDDALSLLEHDAECSFATFITGPSRTADIEKILVLGAHGPKRLIVLMIG